MKFLGKLIRFFLRAFFAWTAFIFLLGALFAALGGQRNHVGVYACDIIFLVGLAAGISYHVQKHAAKKALAEQQALAAAAEAGEPVYGTVVAAGQAVTAVTVFIGNQPGQIAAVTSQVPAHHVPFAQPAALPAGDAYAETPATWVEQPAEPAQLPDPFDDLPGARGARMALADKPVEDTPPGQLAVRFRGEVKAYVTREAWHKVGDFADLPETEPEYRLVANMAAYAMNILHGYGSDYTDQDAIVYAIGQLVPHEALERDMPDPAETALGLGIPADVLTPDNLVALRQILAARNAAAAQTPDVSW